MGIEDEDVVRVRDQTDLVDLISGHLQLRRVGRRWQGLCPFHNEKTPSFSVNGELGFYKCFGCNKSGDAITFIREIEHLDFVGAVEFLANRAGIQLRYTKQNEGRDRRRKANLHEAVEKAIGWYHERLLTAPDASTARGYLRSRGFDGDQVRRYQIGWAPDGWDLLYRDLRVKQEVFVEAGLGFVNRAKRVQDQFRGRVLFPIHDANGSGVGFGGRILPGAEGPKYKNSSDSPIYQKSRLLYGLHRSKDEIVRADEVIICEGYTDVMGFDTVGLERAVATCGTSLTEDHVRLLKRFARRIVLAFDADAAGQAAAERIYEWEQAFEIDVAVAKLPDGVDPGDLAGSDPEALVAAVEQAQPFLAFRVARVLGAGNLDTAEGRARTAQRAMAVVREHPSDLVRDQYVMQVADTCHVDPDRLRPLLSGPAPPPPTPPRGRSGDSGSIEVERPAPIVVRDSTEVQLLRLAIHRPGELPPTVQASMFHSDVHREVFAGLLQSETLHQAISQADPVAAEVLSQLAVLDEPEGESDRIVGQFIYEAGVRRLRTLQADARRAGPTADPAHTLDLSQSIVGLQTHLPLVLEANFELAAAEQLVPWLH